MFQARSIRHCKHCGGAVRYSVPADDNRERATCTVCASIHYENPINVVGTVPVWEDRILLCRRNIEPRYGYWTLPAGFLELGESTSEGAIRETIEEAGARIELHHKKSGAAPRRTNWERQPHTSRGLSSSLRTRSSAASSSSSTT